VHISVPPFVVGPRFRGARYKQEVAHQRPMETAITACVAVVWQLPVALRGENGINPTALNVEV
jgi:hypothetical protein